MESCSPNSDNTIITEQLKKAVKCAVEEEDRSRNVVIFGVKEEDGEELENKVLDVFQYVSEKPRVTKCSRIGKKKSGTARAIKVTLCSSDSVHRILRKSGQLKNAADYKTVFLSADRTFEEREARKKLVDELKQKRKSNPELQHLIRNNNIISRIKPKVT